MPGAAPASLSSTDVCASPSLPGIGVSDEDEVIEELRLSLMDAARRVARHIVGKRKEKEKQEKKRMYMKYATEVALAVSELTGKPKAEIEKKLLNTVLKRLKIEEEEDKKINEVSDEEIEKQLEKEAKKEEKKKEKKSKKGKKKG